jgi:hypothetical protein
MFHDANGARLLPGYYTPITVPVDQGVCAKVLVASGNVRTVSALDKPTLHHRGPDE